MQDIPLFLNHSVVNVVAYDLMGKTVSHFIICSPQADQVVHDQMLHRFQKCDFRLSQNRAELLRRCKAWEQRDGIENLPLIRLQLQQAALNHSRRLCRYLLRISAVLNLPQNLS